MKKILVLSSLLLANMAFAQPTQTIIKKLPATIEGCTQSVNNKNHEPTGSGQLCFFENGKFLGVGFGFLKFGSYRIADGVLQMRFIRPSMYEVMSAFDPKQKGVAMQFKGFNEGSDTAYHAMIGFDKQAFHPILETKDSCTASADDKRLDNLNDIHLYETLDNQPTVWHFHIPKGHNRVVIVYQNANDEIFRLRQTAITFKNNQIYLLDDEGKPDSVIEPLGHSDDVADKEMQDFKKISSMIDTKRTSVMRNEFDEFEDNPAYYTFNKTNNTYKLKPSAYKAVEASSYENFDGRYDTIRRYQVLTPRQNPVVLADLTVDKTALFSAKCSKL